MCYRENRANQILNQKKGDLAGDISIYGDITKNMLGFSKNKPAFAFWILGCH
jgi:hypothetical protein